MRMSQTEELLTIEASVERRPAHSIRIHVSIRAAGARRADGSGLPGFIVQVDPPAGVQLTGKQVTSFEDLRGNEFLMEPWERLAETGDVTIDATMSGDVDATATVGIIVTGYLASLPGEDDVFVRQRLEVRPSDGAISRPGDSSDSTWGPAQGQIDADDGAPNPVLAIGDRAATFILPALAGGNCDVGALIGREPFVLVTYRGFW